MSKKYVIKYSGLFEDGYVRCSLLNMKSKTIRFDTEQQVLEFATKFAFKSVANLCCWMLNKGAKYSYSFRSYSIKEMPAA